MRCEIAARRDLRRIVVNTHYRAEQIAAHLAGRDVMRLARAAGFLDTGGGLRAGAAPCWARGRSSPSTRDAVWPGPNPLRELAAAWDPTRMDALLALACRPTHAIGHAGAGDFVIGRARPPDARARPGLYRRADHRDRGAARTSPSGVFSLNSLWDQASGRGGVLRRASIQGGWCDVGHPDGIALAEAMLSDAGDV